MTQQGPPVPDGRRPAILTRRPARPRVDHPGDDPPADAPRASTATARRPRDPQLLETPSCGSSPWRTPTATTTRSPPTGCGARTCATTTATARSPADGVDLNRNFPTRWGYDDEGSSPARTARPTAAPRPASEPETRALDGLMRRVGFEFLINYHSAAELLLYGTGWQVATPTPDDVLYEVMAGDDAEPAVPGYDPDISAELYTTNGETTEHAQEAYGTLAFTPEMSTCQTASAADPDDEFKPEDCEQRLRLPRLRAADPGGVREERPVRARRGPLGAGPARPRVGRRPHGAGLRARPVRRLLRQPADRSPSPRGGTCRSSTLHYRIDGGREQPAPVEEWAGGERYGDEGDVYYAEFRGEVPGRARATRSRSGSRGSRPGAARSRASPSPTRWPPRPAPTSRARQRGLRGLQPRPARPGDRAPVRAAVRRRADAAGVSTAVWDVDAQGVPHHLGVLGHFDAVVWYLGDNRLTQDAEDVVTETFLSGPRGRRRRRTSAVPDARRPRLPQRGRQARLTGETAGYYGMLGTARSAASTTASTARPSRTAWSPPTSSATACCWPTTSRSTTWAPQPGAASGPRRRSGTGAPITGQPAAWRAAVATTRSTRSGRSRPPAPCCPLIEFPQFASAGVRRLSRRPPGNLETFEGDWFAGGARTRTTPTCGWRGRST